MVILPEKVVEQALEALELHMNDEGSILRSRMAWDALRQALESKPGAWGNFQDDGTLVGLSQHPEDQVNWAGRRPLYAPPKAEPKVCKPSTMKKGGRYNWKGQPERLVYVGRSNNGLWFQFEKVGAPGAIWCEVLARDLGMLEETIPQPVAYEWRYDSCGYAVINKLVITETPEPTVFLKNVFARGPFPLYRQQQPVQWVCLTDEEMDGALRRSGVVATFAALRCVGKEVEAKLREKNGGAT